MVTDCPAEMACEARSSVRAGVRERDAKWMGCASHQINNALKDCVASLAISDLSELRRSGEDLKALKTVVRIFKQGEWISMLPLGFHLKQESETRFGPIYIVVERFLKAHKLVEEIVLNKDPV